MWRSLSTGRLQVCKTLLRKVTSPPFTANERARLEHCLHLKEMRPHIQHLLKGATARHEIDDKVGRLQPYKALANVFNDPDNGFTNFFVDHPCGDDDLLDIDPNTFRPRPDSFLKGEDLFFYGAPPSLP